MKRQANATTLTFKQIRNLTKDIPSESVVTNTLEAFLESQSVLSIPVILLKEFVQKLLSVSSLVVEGHGTAAVLIVMNVVNPNSE